MRLIQCPKCGSKVKLRPRSFSQWRKEWRKGKRQCHNCGAWLEFSNPVFVGGIIGLVSGAIAVSSRYWGFTNQWLTFAIVILICLLLMAIIIKTLGRWEVIPEGFEDSPKVQFWSRVLSISIWFAVITVAVTVIRQGLMIRKLMMTLQSTSHDPDILEQAIQLWWVSFKINAVVGYGVSAIAFMICIVASFMRRRARIPDKLCIASD
ncbi:MAG: hypothetical protein ACYS30_24885 [Planctomycetota bacterium]|jgi:hypothetical protein